MKRSLPACLFFLPAFFILSSISCGGSASSNNADDADSRVFSNAAKSGSSKEIQSFEFLAENNPDYLSSDIAGTAAGNTITLRVPPYTNRTSLIPTISHSGTSISPGSGEAVDFSRGKVKYTVTAEDGTKTDYSVSIQRQHWVRRIEYVPVNNEIDPDNDEITGYVSLKFHKDGNRSGSTRYISGGKDNVWFNGDDDIESASTYNRAGDMTGRYLFKSPGPDGKYHTKDDIYESYLIDAYDANGNRVAYKAGNSAGSDGIWLTEDDGFSALSEFEYENNLLIKEIQYSGPGAPSCYYLYNYNDDLRIDIEWKYIGPGSDGKWFTEDDELLTEKTFRYDEAGNITRETTGYYNYDYVSYWHSSIYDYRNRIIEKIEYDKKGADSTWFTDDDVVYSKECHEYDRYGLETLFIDSDSAGRDRIWFTSDDDINSYSIYEYTESAMTHTSYYWPGSRIGPDRLWFTDDDIPWQKTYILYNIIKNVKKDQEIYISSGGAGPDGTWFTEDDINLYSYTRNRFDRHGNFLGTTYYNGAGDDGVWLTDDDVIDYYDVYIWE